MSHRKLKRHHRSHEKIENTTATPPRKFNQNLGYTKIQTTDLFGQVVEILYKDLPEYRYSEEPYHPKVQKLECRPSPITNQWAMQQPQDIMQDLRDHMEAFRKPIPWTVHDEARLAREKDMYEKYMKAKASNSSPT